MEKSIMKGVNRSMEELEDFVMRRWEACVNDVFRVEEWMGDVRDYLCRDTICGPRRGYVVVLEYVGGDVFTDNNRGFFKASCMVFREDVDLENWLNGFGRERVLESRYGDLRN